MSEFTEVLGSVCTIDTLYTSCKKDLDKDYLELLVNHYSISDNKKYKTEENKNELIFVFNNLNTILISRGESVILLNSFSEIFKNIYDEQSEYFKNIGGGGGSLYYLYDFVKTYELMETKKRNSYPLYGSFTKLSIDQYDLLNIKVLEALRKYLVSIEYPSVLQNFLNKYFPELPPIDADNNIIDLLCEAILNEICPHIFIFEKK